MSATNVTSEFGADYERRMGNAAVALREAEFLLVGGGAGLSDAAGLRYTGKRFTDNFAPFITKYGFDDLYTSSFYPFPTQEEKWAYWAKHISLNRYETAVTELYKTLFRLICCKPYFVLTTNVDAQFQKAGIPEANIFAVQGDYGYCQCARGCHNQLYANESAVAEMLLRTENCKIPPALVPVCPVCHGPMDVWVHKDDNFVRDQRWHEAEKRCKDFLRSCAGRKVVLLELGVGFNTPGIIRFPFEELLRANPQAVLIRANRDHPDGPGENAGRTLAFTEDMASWLHELLQPCTT